MSWSRMLCTLAALGTVFAIPVHAADVAPTATPTSSDRPTPEAQREVVVVTASRLEEALADVPSTMSIIPSESLATMPAQNYGDILRTVPGVNVIQTSARDINVASRAATSTLENSQLGLVDGRSINLELFGVILWDLIPVSPQDIKQIEVIRGPASAVWGSNALTGAVNIITKTPREAAGTSATLSGGLFSRDAGASAGDGPGGSYSASLNVARAPNDEWSYRISAAILHSDTLPRPTGVIPKGTHPADSTVETGGGTYPTYANVGTTQPKLDIRVDQQVSPDLGLSYSTGIAGTSGIFHTGVGPFELQPGSVLGYGRVSLKDKRLRVSATANILDADAPNRILKDPRTGDFVQGTFKTQTYDLEAADSFLLGQHQSISFGGNVRHSHFDISIAKNPEDRNELGAYVQDEVFYGHFRFTLGGRVDKFSVIDKAVFSPRLAAIFQPGHEQSFRLSFNKAFRSPSVINNSLQIETVQPVDLRGLAPLLPPPLRPAVANPFPLIVEIAGDPNLKEESLTAYEIAYTGRFGGHTTLTASYYINDRDDSINFVELPPNTRPYTASNPPPGFPLPPSLLTALAASGIFLPETAATYENLGPIRERGLELGIDHTFRPGLAAFANYSHQQRPKPKASDHPYPASEINVPPANRFNVGLDVKVGRFFGVGSVSYSDGAFWSDVLTAEFHGSTPSFTMLNATLGVRANEHVTVSLKGTNLTNKDIQQHIFGDILKRSIVAELRATF